MRRRLRPQAPTPWGGRGREARALASVVGLSQGRGFIRRGGSALAGVTGGSLTFSNNLERVRVIREDGKIEAADPTFASAEGTMSVRFDGATLVTEAANGDPVVLDYGFTFPEGYGLRFELPRVFQPKPKYAVSGR